MDAQELPMGDVAVPSGLARAAFLVAMAPALVAAGCLEVTTPPEVGPLVLPQEVEAGVPFLVRYHVNGTGRMLAGVHAAPADQDGSIYEYEPPSPFEGSEWAVVYEQSPGDFPRDVALEITIPHHGPWILRGHVADRPGREVGSWSPVKAVEVTAPHTPNLQFLLLTAPCAREEDGAWRVCGPATFRFRVNAPQGTVPESMGIAWANETSASLPEGSDIEDWKGVRTVLVEPVPLPAVASGNWTLPDGTYHFRAFARIAGHTYWSTEEVVQSRVSSG